MKINDPNGPASLIGNMKSVKAKDDKTVVFTLKNPNDQTWPFVLGTSAGPIVDSKVFSPTKLLDDTQGRRLRPVHRSTATTRTTLVQLKANPNYGGDNKPKTSGITLKYYTESSNMKLDVQSGDIDIAWRSLTPTDVASLKKDKLGQGAHRRRRRDPLHGVQPEDDARRQRGAEACDPAGDRVLRRRDDLANNVFQGTYQPLYSMVPQGIAGATQPFKTEFGTAPDKTKAAAELSGAGVKTPVSLHIQYTTDHYGPTSADEYNEIKRQLEATGLFKVTIQGTAYTTYSPERVKDTYPIYQLGWFPDFVDADNYLCPFLGNNNFVGAHYCDDNSKTHVTNRPCDKDGVLPLLTKEETTVRRRPDPGHRQIQKKLATGVLPLLPLLQGTRSRSRSRASPASRTPWTRPISSGSGCSARADPALNDH